MARPLIKKTDSSLAPTITLRELIALAVILLVALLVRIPGLTESLWFDEVWYTQTTFARPGILGQILFKDVHPPTYTLLLLAWTDLFGDSELAVRMPSLLCGSGSLLLLWFIARRWMGPLQALLVTTLLALSPSHIWYSYENKVNMMLLLLTLYAVWLYWRASETRLGRDWFVATMVLVVALYTHAYAVPVAAAIYIWLAWRAWSDRSIVKPLFVSGVVIALVFAPLVLFKFGQSGELARGYLRQLSPVELYKLLLIWLPSGNTLRMVSPYSSFADLARQPWPHFLIEAFFAFLLGRGLLVVGCRARGDGWLAPVTNPAVTEPARLILLWFIIPLVLTIAGSMVTKDFYIERNLLVILPPFIFLLVAGADIGAPRWARISVITGLVALAITATVSLRFIKTEIWTVYKYKPDWRAAAYYFSDEMMANGVVRVLFTNPTYEYSYYHRRIILAKAPPGSRQEPLSAHVCNDDPKTILQGIVRKGWSPVYLVQNKTWGGCWDTIWELFSTAPQLHLVEQRDFRGLTIYKFSL
jgi:uncharacterized membrane protein